MDRGVLTEGVAVTNLEMGPMVTSLPMVVESEMTAVGWSMEEVKSEK